LIVIGSLDASRAIAAKPHENARFSRQTDDQRAV